MSVRPDLIESDLRSPLSPGVGAMVSHHPAPSGLRRVPRVSSEELRIHRSLTELEALETAWRELTPGNASPFQTFSWNLAWYRSYSDVVGSPLIFELVRDAVTVAILPCYLCGKTIRLAGDPTGDFQDVISATPESVDVLLSRLLKWLNGEGRAFHFHFQKLSSEGFLFKALRESGGLAEQALLHRAGFVRCPCVPLNGGLEDYLGSLPQEQSEDLRNLLNRLERDAPISRVTTLRDYEIRVDDLENAARFHLEHFRGKGKNPFRDSRLMGLFGEVVKDPDVGFTLAFMTHRGDLLSVDFGFVRGGRYYGYLSAFDGEFAPLDPEKALLMKRIDEWVKEDGVEILDFLSGGETCRRDLVDDSAYAVWSIHLMPRDLKNRIRLLGLEGTKRLQRLSKGLTGRA